jgi:hypothetical protein
MSRRPLFLALLLLGAGCYPETPVLWKTQRLPRPMRSTADPLPPGTLERYPPGPEEVVVLRHADPVQIRPAGMPSSFPMPFYRKQARANSGTWVFCGAGGRLEVNWPSGSAIVLDGRGTAVIGSPSRGEPTLVMYELSRARIMLAPEDRVALLGGSLLTIDAVPEGETGTGRGGPFVVEHVSEEIVRLINRSKRPCNLRFREAPFRIEPGESIDLPLLEIGGDPRQPEAGFQTLPGGIEVRGAVEIVSGPDGDRLRAAGDHEMHGFGVRVRLDEGEEADFLDLDGRGVVRAAAQSDSSSEESGGE